MNIKSRVTIVGAGAAGLQCANDLITKYGYRPEDIIILEGRDRIGGRIYTSTEICIDNDRINNVHFPLDHGAAWVHGLGVDWDTPIHHHHTNDAPSQPSDQNINKKTQQASYEDIAKPRPNPMVPLLQQMTSTDTTIYEQHLHNTVCGNPWMRPKHVLHDTNQINVFCNGRHIPNNSIDVTNAIERYYETLQQVSILGNDLFHKGLGMETVHLSLQDAINIVTDQQKQKQDDAVDVAANDNDDVVALTKLYQHLLECWYGASSSDLQLCEFVEEKDDENDSDDNGSDSNNNSIINNNSDNQNIENRNTITSSTNAWIHRGKYYTEEGDFYGPHCTVQQGMETVLQPLLLNGIQERILLNHEVITVDRYCANNTNDQHTTTACVDDDYDDTGAVLVTCANGISIRASDACVVTIPAGCLKDACTTMFCGKLSSDKVDAISHTDMGTYKKIFLTFQSIFWPIEPTFLGLLRTAGDDINNDTCPLGHVLLVDNLWASRYNIPCLEVVLFGKQGKWATNKSDETIRDVVIEFIYDALGIQINDRVIVNDCHITRWEEDKFSRGAYSAMMVGATPHHHDELNRPEWDGSLIFSGEVTISHYEGSVHAALFSGTNAASKVYDTIVAKKQQKQQQQQHYPTKKSEYRSS